MSNTTAAPLTLTYVSGSTDSEQQLDLYLPPSGRATSLVVFIHGGAWRTGSRKDHVDLAQYLCARGKAVAVIDYRLSVMDDKTGLPKHIHPVHVEDVHAALGFLRSRPDVPHRDWVVVGHSIGAWLALAAIIDGEAVSEDAEYPKPMPRPDPATRQAIKTWDGIYSIEKLLKEYPDYEGFVAQAFLPQPGPANYSLVSCEAWPLALEGKKLHIWHSRDDELLSFKQSIDALLHLDTCLPPSDKPVTVTIPEDGVASTTTVDGEKKSIASLYPSVKIRNTAQLSADFTTLSGAHDGLLHTETFWNHILDL
ncbi:related to Serine protease [Sporisorium reilianum SRZ2]|uniref:Related to Serine protease n=1 Tax=Sporisorium reilianum (strain SRZ2) TaxID=999809 RepID=E6ZJL8_SPORE|nr:related to Serine protease [Sporisorium reilianum SRZ2]